MANENRNWVEFDVDSFPAALRKEYDAFKEASAKARDLRTAFEASFVKLARKEEMIDPTQDVLMSYNFGKFSTAVVGREDKAKKAGSSKPKLGFKR